MPEQTVHVASTKGLHARPASLFSQAAARSGIPVQLAHGDKSVNAASILGVISLGLAYNDEVTITAEGDTADAVLTELSALLAVNHDA